MTYPHRSSPRLRCPYETAVHYKQQKTEHLFSSSLFFFHFFCKISLSWPTICRQHSHICLVLILEPGHIWLAHHVYSYILYVDYESFLSAVFYSLQFSAVHCKTVQWILVKYNPLSAIYSSAVQKYSAVQCNTMQFIAIPCTTVQCSAGGVCLPE